MFVKTKLSHSTKQLAWVYLLAAAGVGIPLVTIPYLARVLGPEAWGRVLGAQGVAMLLVAIVDFGFSMSGTRQVAQAVAGRPRAEGDRQRCPQCEDRLHFAGWRRLVFLSAIDALFRGHHLILVMSLVWGIAGGLNFGWYFQGTGRAVLFFAIESLARLIGVGATFLLVRRPEDECLALAANAMVVCLALVCTFPIAVIETGWPRMTLRGALPPCVGGGHLAMYVLLGGICNSFNRVILGFLAGPTTVAIYGNAERVTDILNRGCDPASQVIYPIMCREVVTSPVQARRSLWRAVAFLGAALGVGRRRHHDRRPADHRALVRVALRPVGSRFASVARPAAAEGGIDDGQYFWALPLGFDRHLAPSVLLAAAVTVGAAVVLVPPFGALGMAAAAILSETTFLFASAVFLVWRRCFPFLPLTHPLASGKKMRPGTASDDPSGVLALQEQTP